MGSFVKNARLLPFEKFRSEGGSLQRAFDSIGALGQSSEYSTDCRTSRAQIDRAFSEDKQARDNHRQLFEYHVRAKIESAIRARSPRGVLVVGLETVNIRVLNLLEGLALATENHLSLK